MNTPGPGINSVYQQSEHWGGGASVYDQAMSNHGNSEYKQEKAWDEPNWGNS